MSNIFVSIVKNHQLFNEAMGYRPCLHVHNDRVVLGLPKIVSWPKYISVMIVSALFTMYTITNLEKGNN